MPSISLPLHSYALRAAQASTSRLVNCYVEQLPPDDKTPALLMRAPGLPSWGTVGTGPIESLHSDHGSLYVVSGGGFYTVTSGAVATLRGAVGSSSEIDIDSSLLATVIVSPPNAYTWTLATSTFAQITDADFTTRGAGDVEHLDGYMLFREPDTARFFGSDLNDAAAYDALNFATAEGASDVLVGMKVDHRQIILAGEKSIELWENTGVSGFPFERSINGFLELGCLNGKTIAKIDNSVFWVASDYSVRRLDGLTPVRISSHAVEQWLKGATLASLRAWTFTQEGHLFYMLTAPEGAFFYDITTQLWAERGSYGFDTWNWGNPVEFAGKVLVGSTTSNVIAELSPTVYEDLGDLQVMTWTYQAVKPPDGSRRAYFSSLEVVLEVGVGLTTGQGSDPQMMLSISDDAGRTWLALPTKTIGAIGKYRTRVRWAGLGSTDSPHGRVFRFSISDPIQVAVVDALLDYHG